MTLHTFKRQLRAICSTSDVSRNGSNIHHWPALLWRLSWFWRRIQNCRLTYLLFLLWLWSYQ